MVSGSGSGTGTADAATSVAGPSAVMATGTAFGGMVAEELFFGEHSSGVSGDLQAATTAVCQMVGSLGMGRSLVSAEALSGTGAANVVAKVLSHDAGRDEVEAMLADAKARVHRMLEDHRHVVEALRDALLQRDELIAGEILDVIRSAASTASVLPAPKPVSAPTAVAAARTADGPGTEVAASPAPVPDAEPLTIDLSR